MNDSKSHSSPEKIRAWLDAQVPACLDLLQSWVVVNSFTNNRAGVLAHGRQVAKAFDALGFQAEFVPSKNPDYASHLVLTHGEPAASTVGLITHLDTVFTADEEARNGFRWRVAGDKIYGPGVNDIKGGTAMIWLVLGALEKFFPGQFRATRWVILANAAEERLAPDFAPLCRERLGADVRAALVFEAGSPQPGSIAFPLVVARKGRAEWSFAVEGRGAHAGAEPANGANAVVQAAHLIPRIAMLQDLGRDLSVNVGAVNGGTVTNRVPSCAVIHGECRAFDPTLLDETVNRLRALSDLSKSGTPIVRSEADGHACRATFTPSEVVSPWPDNPATDQMWKIWQSVGGVLGMSILREHRGGISDGNALAGDLPVLDGLGPTGANSHCSERSEDGTKEPEYLEISSIAPKALLNTLALARLTQQIVSDILTCRENG